MKKILLLIFGLLALPVFCSGAVSYERSPADYTINNPVSFSVSALNLQELIDWCELGQYGVSTTDIEKVGIVLSNIVPQHIETKTIPFSADFVITDDLPFDTYGGVWLRFWEYEEADFWDCEKDFEGVYNSIIPIFEIVEPVNPFALPVNSVNSTIAYIGDLFTSIGGFIWLIIGIPLGFIVIKRIIVLMPK